MIAPLEVVKGMPEIPHHCILCSNNPADEITGEQMPAIFAPGVDYDWGSSVYICWSCAEIISDLCGRVTRDGFDKLQKKHETLTEAHEELKEQHERAKALLDRIRDGRAAVKEARTENRA